MVRRIGLFLVPPAYDTELGALGERAFEALRSGEDHHAIEAELFARLARMAIATRVVPGRSDSITSVVELVSRATKKRWDDLSTRARREATTAALSTLPAARRTPFFTAVAEFLREPVDATAGFWLQEEPRAPRPVLARLGMYLAPARTSEPELRTRATASRHLQVDGARAMWESFTERVEDVTGKAIDGRSPVELREAVEATLAKIKKSRRGPIEDELVELLTQAREGDGLWVIEEEPLPEPEPEVVSPEESMRRLDAFVEENRAKKRRLGPRAGTPLVLRIIEAPADEIENARRSAQAQKIEFRLQAIDVALSDDVVVTEEESQVVGDLESIRRLLELLPAASRTDDDLYSPTEARALLAAFDALEKTHGGSAKLVALLDRHMKSEWPFAIDPPKSVAKDPVARFLAVLRRAVKNGNGFAVVEKRH
ncbi:MAG: hypothetical protein AB7T06_11340 [Kofleriaceae bacterium]